MTVLWICNFSNPEVRSQLSLNNGLDFLVRRFLNKKNLSYTDYGIWNTNGINEVKKYKTIELHVISPHANLRTNVQSFVLDGVHYYFYRVNENTLFGKICQKLLRRTPSYNNSRKVISDIISHVKPDIIHIIGAENPSYSLAALDISRDVPLIVQLQTVINDPKLKEKSIYFPEYVLQCERDVIKRADYIGCSELDVHFRNVIEKYIAKNKIYLNLDIPNGLSVQISNCEKKYDFVYFSANINKSFDLALEAFILAHNINSSLTLDVIGHYDQDFKSTIDKRIKENNLQEFIHFEGHQETYKEVLNLVKQCKVALLPLKIDLISSTIRESMALGVPVITTITPGTPELNSKRESVLLSDIGDYAKMAENMVKIIEDTVFYNLIQKNAAQTIKDLFDNSVTIAEWIAAYKNISSNENKE